MFVVAALGSACSSAAEPLTIEEYAAERCAAGELINLGSDDLASLTHGEYADLIDVALDTLKDAVPPPELEEAHEEEIRNVRTLRDFLREQDADGPMNVLSLRVIEPMIETDAWNELPGSVKQKLQCA